MHYLIIHFNIKYIYHEIQHTISDRGYCLSLHIIKIRVSENIIYNIESRMLCNRPDKPVNQLRTEGGNE